MSSKCTNEILGRSTCGDGLETLEAGVNTLLKVAMDILAAKWSKLMVRFEEIKDIQDDGQRKKVKRFLVIMSFGRGDSSLTRHIGKANRVVSSVNSFKLMCFVL